LFNLVVVIDIRIDIAIDIDPPSIPCTCICKDEDVFVLKNPPVCT